MLDVCDKLKDEVFLHAVRKKKKKILVSQINKGF